MGSIREFIVETDMDLSCVTEFTGAGGVSFKPHGELIRCKDCKFMNEYDYCTFYLDFHHLTADMDYCSDAKREEE
ncbi:MAG: hypothetical protein IJH05_03580 [Firmicutes bacterium]|nr:hypothetical protein [Bacillota bacterium]